ncbi:MAG TPA: BT4734/BF3469 family protein [Verrucomicrobiae bacterium]|nr:BT4734/BF3469 family protein [Verrucomicrobiae bacterium]
MSELNTVATPTGTNTCPPTGKQPSHNLVEYRGLRVVAGTTYDLERKVSVGTATGNDITKSVTVAEALEFIRSDKARKTVELARLAQKEMAVRIEEILREASETGELIVEKDDQCFLKVDEKKLWPQAHKDLVGAVTGIYQEFALDRKESWADVGQLSAARAEILALAWRMAKAQYLPGWTFAGLFSLRTISNITRSAGLMPLDFDHVADVPALIAKIKADPLFFACEKSPSLTGVKAQVRIPDDAAKDPKVYLRCFETAERYIMQFYPEVTLGVDKQAKAVSQLTFFMHDPEAFCRPDSYILLPDDAQAEGGPKQKHNPGIATVTTDKPTIARKPKTFPFNGYSPEKQWEVVKSATDALMAHLEKVPSGPGDRNGFWTRLGYAYRDWMKDVDSEALINEARQYLLDLADEHYGGGTQPVQNALDSGGGECGLGTLFKLAMDYAGWVPPWRSKVEDIVVLPSGEVTISKCAEEVFKRIGPSHTLFNRGGVVVEVSYDKQGNAYLEPIKADGFRSRVEKFGRLMAWRQADKESVLKPSKMSVDDAKALLASKEMAEYLPPISSVLRCAVITENDKGELVVLGNGYHPENGGMLIVQANEVPEVPLEEAKELLLSIVAEFEFQSAGDKSRNLAARITPALRMGGFIEGSIPLDVMEADQPQAGKGYSHAITTAFYNETAYYVAQRDGGVGSWDESFATGLMTGRPFIALDNTRGRLDSPYFESFLTCPGLFGARVPGSIEALVDPKRFLVQLTSNGMESTSDLAARSSICRILKPEKPYVDMPGMVRAEQAAALGCIFAVVREWHRRGKPRRDGTGHDFHEWCGILDYIVQAILGCAPLMQGHKQAQARVSDPVQTWIRQMALAAKGENKLKHPFTASDLVELCILAGIEIPRVGSSTDVIRTRKIVGLLMRRVFKNGNEVDVEGFKLSRSELTYEKESGHSDTTYAYTFECV